MRDSGIGFVFLGCFVTFFLQWFVLGFVFKNLRLLSGGKSSFWSPPRKIPPPLAIMASSCFIITNNYIYPQGTNNEQTMVTMIYVFNLISCLVLVAAHFVVGFMRKEKKQ